MPDRPGLPVSLSLPASLTSRPFWGRAGHDEDAFGETVPLLASAPSSAPASRAASPERGRGVGARPVFRFTTASPPRRSLFESFTSLAFTPDSRRRLAAWQAKPEARAMAELAEIARLSPADTAQVLHIARTLAQTARTAPRGCFQMIELVKRFPPDSLPGQALQKLVVELPQAPDKAAADRVIADCLTAARFVPSPGQSDSLRIALYAHGLQLGGALLGPGKVAVALRPAAKPAIRWAVNRAVQKALAQFIGGASVADAMAEVDPDAAPAALRVYEPLGEAAATEQDAKRHFLTFAAGINAAQEGDDIAIKLSALAPGYGVDASSACKSQITARLGELAALAKMRGVALTVDAEAAEVLHHSLDIFRTVRSSRDLAGWRGLGLACQATHKACHELICMMAELGATSGEPIRVRLVKGAYGPQDIAAAGSAVPPVFASQLGTDVSYLACARTMLKKSNWIQPIFATHNAYSIAYVLHLAEQQNKTIELQALRGMSEHLHGAITGLPGADSDDEGDDALPKQPVRTYIPVGEPALAAPYMARRMQELGDKNGFLNRLSDPGIKIEKLVADPLRRARLADQATRRAQADAAAQAVPMPNVPNVPRFTRAG